MKIFCKIFLVAWTFLTTMSYSMAQCAMCRVTIENNVSAGDLSRGAGLNMGIMYLFTVPYVLIAVVWYFWYKNSKRKKRMAFEKR